MQSTVSGRRDQTSRTISYLHLTSVKEFRGIGDETARPVALHTGNDVVGIRLDTLGDDTEAVVLHRSGATDAAEQALLDALLKFDYCYLRGGSGNLDWNLADSEPGNSNTGYEEIMKINITEA
jgi:hypothetical protein